MSFGYRGRGGPQFGFNPRMRGRGGPGQGFGGPGPRGPGGPGGPRNLSPPKFWGKVGNVGRASKGNPEGIPSPSANPGIKSLKGLGLLDPPDPLWACILSKSSAADSKSHSPPSGGLKSEAFKASIKVGIANPVGISLGNEEISVGNEVGRGGRPSNS